MTYDEELFEANKKATRAVKPWDLLNPNEPRALSEKAQARLAICEQCPFFRATSKTCSKCGCFMKLKVTLDNAYCPMHKW